MTGRRGVRKQATSTGGPQTLGAGLGQVTLVTHDQYVDRDRRLRHRIRAEARVRKRVRAHWSSREHPRAAVGLRALRRRALGVDGRRRRAPPRDANRPRSRSEGAGADERARRERLSHSE